MHFPLNLELLPGLHEVNRTKHPKEYEVFFELDSHWDPLPPPALNAESQRCIEEMPAAATVVLRQPEMQQFFGNVGAAVDVMYNRNNHSENLHGWKLLHVGYFYPNLPLLYGPGDCQTVGSDVHWRNVHLFTSACRTAATNAVKGDIIKQNFPQLLRAQLSDGTNLNARMNQGWCTVTAAGNIDSIAEMRQSLAWLGAALRSSPFEDGVSTCTPHLKEGRSTSASFKCEITFEIHRPLEKEEGTPGRCWHHMFRNPVMVGGYPILAKPEHRLGLEMPLNMMAIMAGADRVDEFDGKIYIKGFSTMLIATRLVGDMMIWHYFYNSKGERNFPSTTTAFKTPKKYAFNRLIPPDT
ncbi:hypothetical protein F5Y04DRAFT_289679 [Hypomontagnella monticulosa]|nr:hypothetical protein F5Y04DRAFT_289679 [Hypomontagnella monticulosa]